MSSAVGVLTCHQGVVRFGRGMALASAVLLAAMLTPTIGFADAIVYGDFTEEMMMEAQLQDQLLIELAIAWNPADIVAYDYSLPLRFTRRAKPSRGFRSVSRVRPSSTARRATGLGSAAGLPEASRFKS